MANTSATGGYLVPVGNQPIEDDELEDFYHDLIVGVTDLSPKLVRPAYQDNPPTRPQITVNWCAFSINNYTPDSHPYLRKTDTGAIMIRHDQIDTVVSFYGPKATYYANMFRDGMYLAQNGELMMLNGFGLLRFGPSMNVPELFNEQYYNRTDVEMSLMREVKREYAILDFASANVDVLANDAYEKVIEQQIVITN